VVLVQYDPDVDVLYFKLRPVAAGNDKGARALDERRLVHYGADDEPVGVEILDASDGFALDGLPHAEEIKRTFADVHRLPLPA
jgi:uncharacterized protein YuzE